MADERRCPMCGRPNPADAEVCRHCGARLTFLGAGEAAAGPADDAFSTDWFEKPETVPQERPPSTDDTAWLRGFFATNGEDEPAADLDWAREEPAADDEALPDSGELRARLDAWTGPTAEAEEPGGGEPMPRPESEAPAAGETDWIPPWAAAETGPTTEPEEPSRGEAVPSPEAEAPAAGETDWIPPWAAAETGPTAEPGEPSPSRGEAVPRPTSEPTAGETDWIPPWAAAETGPTAEPEEPGRGEAVPRPTPEPTAGETDWIPPWTAAETGPTVEPEEPGPGRGEAMPSPEAEAPAAGETGWLPPWLDQETATLAADAQVPAELEPEPEEVLPEAPAEEPVPQPPEPPRMARQTGELALSVEEIEELLGGVEEGEPPPPPEELFTEPETPTEEEPAAELDRAQVPEWLRQAAPVTEEPRAPSVVEEILEGPAVGDESAPEALVGIPDVLPAVPDVARPRVRSRAPLTLRLTRRQEQRAQWLQELLQAEKQPRTLGVPWSTLRFGWLRAGVGLLLMLVAALWAASPWPLRAAPAPHPAWQGVYAAVEGLPPQAPVLLVVDASWATAPEVRAAARPVLQHLARKQAQVLQVSTVPWGVGVLAPPEAASPWVDLGYMPGGAVWMAQLTRTLPYALTGGAAAWPPANAPAWAGVQQAGQTALVVVVTDSPEQARLWAEQVAPALGPASGLAFVLSAQAGPWTEPYLAAAGVRGAVVGVEAGLAYGQALGLDMTATQDLWARYQGAWLLATVLMVVAGVGAGLLQRVARRERRKSQAG